MDGAALVRSGALAVVGCSSVFFAAGCSTPGETGFAAISPEMVSTTAAGDEPLPGAAGGKAFDCDSLAQWCRLVQPIASKTPTVATEATAIVELQDALDPVAFRFRTTELSLIGIAVVCCSVEAIIAGRRGIGRSLPSVATDTGELDESLSAVVLSTFLTVGDCESGLSFRGGSVARACDRLRSVAASRSSAGRGSVGRAGGMKSL